MCTFHRSTQYLYFLSKIVMAIRECEGIPHPIVRVFCPTDTAVLRLFCEEVFLVTNGRGRDETHHLLFAYLFPMTKVIMYLFRDECDRVP